MNERSIKKLDGVHPDLVKVVMHADEAVNFSDSSRLLGFVVTEGLRTEKRQAQLFAVGASKTMNSRHLTGHAIDLAATINGGVRWDWPLYDKLAEVMKTSAKELNIPIEWGGDWAMRDGPHFQLTWKDYPNGLDSNQRSA